MMSSVCRFFASGVGKCWFDSMNVYIPKMWVAKFGRVSENYPLTYAFQQKLFGGDVL